MVERQQFRIPTIGVSVDSAGCDVDDLVVCAAVQVRAGADEPWDSLVERAVASGWVGVECLAGVAGRVADVTRDNAAAYGQAVADTVAAVRAWDRKREAQRTFPLVECEFRAGGSRFQEVLADGSPRFEILDVAFLLRQGDLTEPVRDPALAQALGVQIGQRASLAAVRDLVVGLDPTAEGGGPRASDV